MTSRQHVRASLTSLEVLRAGGGRDAAAAAQLGLGEVPGAGPRRRWRRRRVAAAEFGGWSLWPRAVPTVTAVQHQVRSKNDMQRKRDSVSAHYGPQVMDLVVRHGLGQVSSWTIVMPLQRACDRNRFNSTPRDRMVVACWCSAVRLCQGPGFRRTSQPFKPSVHAVSTLHLTWARLPVAARMRWQRSWGWVRAQCRGQRCPRSCHRNRRRAAPSRRARAQWTLLMGRHITRSPDMSA